MDIIKLLLVDDLEENLLALEAVLRREGIELSRARSGREALELLLRHDFALAIIDVHMPDMTGFELAEMMRGTDRTRRIPIIFLTAGIPDLNRQFLGYESGAVDFLYKPFDPNILVSKVNVFIELARQRQEIVRQRDAIHENEERLRIALETAELSLWDWDLQSDQILWPHPTDVSSNSANCCVSSAASYFEMIHPADVQHVQKTIAHCLETDSQLRCQFRILRSDGTVRWVLWMAKIERDADGQPVRLIGVQRDISAEKVAEEELRSLSDNSPNIIVRFDRKLRHVFVSRSIELITGLKASQFLGKTNRQLGMPQELCDQWDAAIERVFATGDPETIQFSYDSLNGPLRLQSHLVAELDHAGQADFVLVVTRDMTAEWKALKDLEQAKLSAESANAAKDRFLAVLSHELRNPLAPIRMLTTLWEMEKKLPEEYRDGLEMIRRNIDLECRLIDDMLDINRIAQGKLELKYEAVDVLDLIRNVIQIIEPDYQRKRIEFDFQNRAVATKVQADAARIQQVFWNLLNNAVKFTPKGGRIQVIASTPTRGQLSVSVSDSGIGIEPEVIPVIFDAFVQGGQSITRTFGGLGLGLAISKAIAELHHGNLTVTSPGKGLGATFTLDLATVSDAEEPIEHLPNLELVSSGPTGRRLNILLVEDQRAFAKLTERLLQKIGHTVTVASSIAEACSSWHNDQFDLIISDFGLPDGDGCQLLRLIEHASTIPAIALTGFGMEEDIRRAIDSGYRVHLTKPVSFEQLVTAIDRSLATT